MLGGEGQGAAHRSLRRHFPILARAALADPEADVARLHPGRACARRAELCPRQADGRGLSASPPPRARAQIGAGGSRRPMTTRPLQTRASDGVGVAPIRLGINIDHVATLRNARGGRHPDPLRAAKLAVEAGADNITAHLREDRRHITRRRHRAAHGRQARAAQSRDGGDAGDAGDRAQDAAACRLPRAGAAPGDHHRRRARRRRQVTIAEARSSPSSGDAGIQVSLFIDPELRPDRSRGKVGADAIEIPHRHLLRCVCSTGDALRAAERELDALRRRRAGRRQEPGSKCMPAMASTMRMSVPSPRSPRSSSSISAISSWARRSLSVSPRASAHARR